MYDPLIEFISYAIEQLHELFVQSNSGAMQQPGSVYTLLSVSHLKVVIEQALHQLESRRNLLSDAQILHDTIPESTNFYVIKADIFVIQ